MAKSINPNSTAAKSTASERSEGSVSLGLGPWTRLAPYRSPGRTQPQLRFALLDSWEQASELLPLHASLLRCNRTRLPAEQRSPAILPRFPSWSVRTASPRLVGSAPAHCRDDHHTPRCRCVHRALLVALTRELLLLFRHRGRIRTEQGESISNVIESTFVLRSRLPIVDDQTCVVEALQR